MAASLLPFTPIQEVTCSTRSAGEKCSASARTPPLEGCSPRGSRWRGHRHRQQRPGRSRRDAYRRRRRHSRLRGAARGGGAVPGGRRHLRFHREQRAHKASLCAGSPWPTTTRSRRLPSGRRNAREDFAEMGKIASSVTRAQYLGDIRAAADFARGQSWARADRLGVTGFCGGGALTLHTAAEYPGSPRRRRGTAMSSGSIGTRPVSTHSASSIHHHAGAGPLRGRRPGYPLGRRETLRVRAPEANPTSSSSSTPRAACLLLARPAAGLQKEASEDAWKRLLAFFGQHLQV